MLTTLSHADNPFFPGLIYVFERVNADSAFTFRQGLQAPGAQNFDNLGSQSTSLVIKVENTCSVLFF